VVQGGADKVAFLNAGEIWISNLDGSDLRQVTQDGSAKSNVQWEPDGRLILYRWRNCIKSVDTQVKCGGSSSHPERNLPGWDPVAGRLYHLAGRQTNRHHHRTGGFVYPPLQICFSSAGPFAGRAKNPGRLQRIRALPPECMVEISTVACEWAAPGASYSDSEEEVLRDSLRVVDFSTCVEEPTVIQEIPAMQLLFTLEGYFQQPEVASFAWEWEPVHRERLKHRRWMGRIAGYDARLADNQVLEPMGQPCSTATALEPDGEYLIFAYQPETGGDTQLVYASWAEISQGAVLTPLPLPVAFFTDPRLRHSRRCAQHRQRNSPVTSSSAVITPVRIRYYPNTKNRYWSISNYISSSVNRIRIDPIIAGGKSR